MPVKLKWLTLFAFLMSQTSYSQSLLDSLEQSLATVSGTDSVDLMNNIVSNSWGSSLDKAEHYARLAYNKARKIKYDKGEVAALINIGYVYSDRHRMDTAIVVFQKASERAQAIDFLVGVGNANNAIGNTYKDNGKSAESIRYYKEALNIQTKLGNEVGIAAAFNNIGWALKSLGSYNEAIDYLLQALKINRKNKRTRKEALNLLGLAQIRFDQQEAALVIPYLEELTKMKHFADEKRTQADVYNLFGQTYTDLGNYDFAIDNLKKSVDLLREYNNYPAVPMHNLAYAYLKSGQPHKARKAALASLKMKQTKKQEFSTSFTYNLLSDIYLELGDPKTSLEVSLKALEIVKKRKGKSRERKTMLDISEAYQQMGNYQKALVWRVGYDQLKDSLFNAQKSGQQTAMIALFEKDQQEQKIALQKSQIENQNIKERQQKFQFYLVVAGLIILAVIVFLILWSFYRVKRVSAQIALQNDQLSQLNQTKDKFFGIIAHDLRSPMVGLQTVGNQINYYLKKDQKDKLVNLSFMIEKSTKKLTELLDNLLSWALLQNGMITYRPQETLLSETVNQVFDLLRPIAEIKQISLNNKITDNFPLYVEQKALYTILRNIISNALKYVDSGGAVNVSVSHNQEQASISIEDSGIGIPEDQLPKIFGLEKEIKEGINGEKGTGLGLVLCKELVELNHGEIKVNSTVGKGTTFQFSLPHFKKAMIHD